MTLMMMMMIAPLVFSFDSLTFLRLPDFPPEVEKNSSKKESSTPLYLSMSPLGFSTSLKYYKYSINAYYCCCLNPVIIVNIILMITQSILTIFRRSWGKGIVERWNESNTLETEWMKGMNEWDADDYDESKSKTKNISNDSDALEKSWLWSPSDHIIIITPEWFLFSLFVFIFPFISWQLILSYSYFKTPELEVNKYIKFYSENGWWSSSWWSSMMIMLIACDERELSEGKTELLILSSSKS